jgi:tRNA A-37 threonylcarbamoyl transferase component Bud32
MLDSRTNSLMAQHGRYTVVRKLANGGMAEIFLASQQGHEGFQKPVVLKRILGTIYADPQFRNMLIDEAHISMSLTHSNIVQVLDLGLAGGRYFLVLELIDGWDLGHIIQRGRAARLPLPANLGLFVVTEVCRALAYAHAKRGVDGQPLGIVHRDVSPNNVLISEHGEVKLADFGIAKAMNKREHTGTGVVKGKVAFMSPEQGLGKSIDGRSDVFSLGTLLYVVSVGVRPFDATTDLETLLRVQRADFKAPNKVRPDLAPELVSIMTRAMKFSPDERYQTADDMLLDLERLLRSLDGGVGSTELKHYLAELGQRDGVPPSGRAAPLVEDNGSRSGAELVEGNAVVLGDDRDDLADERTDLAEFSAVEGESGPRFTRRAVELGRMAAAGGGGIDGGREVTPARVVRRAVERVEFGGHDLTPVRSGRRAVEELSLPEGDVDEAPPAYRREKSGMLPKLIVLLVLGGGGYALARYMGWTDKLTQMAAPEAAPEEPSAIAPPPEAKVETAKPAKPDKAEHKAEKAERADKAEKSAAKPPTEAEGLPDPGSAGTEPPPPAAAEPARAGADKFEPEQRPRATGGGKPKAAPPAQRDVFKESAKRVRSLQGIEQYPPGTIQLPPPSGESPPAPPAP